LELKIYPKSEETKTCLFSALMLHFLFETLTEKELVQIVDCMKPVEAAAGQVIIKQGDPGDLFYCLLAGTASACIDNDAEVMVYQKGSCFGELALLYNCPRAASVIARTACQLWTLDLK
jgi:cAMP-dependent protein kinase regulator